MSDICPKTSCHSLWIGVPDNRKICSYPKLRTAWFRWESGFLAMCDSARISILIGAFSVSYNDVWRGGGSCCLSETSL